MRVVRSELGELAVFVGKPTAERASSGVRVEGTTDPGSGEAARTNPAVGAEFEEEVWIEGVSDWGDEMWGADAAQMKRA